MLTVGDSRHDPPGQGPSPWVHRLSWGFSARLCALENRRSFCGQSTMSTSEPTLDDPLVAPTDPRLSLTQPSTVLSAFSLLWSYPAWLFFFFLIFLHTWESTILGTWHAHNCCSKSFIVRAQQRQDIQKCMRKRLLWLAIPTRGKECVGYKPYLTIPKWRQNKIKHV